MARADEQRRRRRHSIRGALLFALLVLFCVFMYLERDIWVPRLQSISSRYTSSVTQNAGTLAGGNFPLTLSSVSGYQVKLVEDSLFLLHDAYLDIYSQHGDEEDSRQLSYQDAVLCVNGRYALIYERAGSSFRLDTQNENIYAKTGDDDIITGAVSANGYVALVTDSDSYTCSLLIYDATGNRLYRRNCTERINDVVFHEDSAGCCFVAVDAENGVVQSTVYSILFDQVDTQWTASPLDTLAVQTNIDSDGRLCVVGDTLCAYYGANGEVLGTYTYEGTLLSAAVENGRVALIVQDDEVRQTDLILLNRSAGDVQIVPLDDSASYVQVSDSDAFVMDSGEITSYVFSGDTIATVALEDSYNAFLKRNGYIFLLGYQQIDRVDYAE